MRWLHRMAGMGFSVFVVYFLGYSVIGTLLGQVAPTMVPFPADLREVCQSLLWNAGLADRPLSPRFNYQQKFEFWGLLFGGLLMMVTGLMLYFPIQTARWLPGQFIPAAKTAHSYEAMLALLVIVVWHLYNVIFRPSVFPLDRTMFHGKISLEHLKEKYPLEYERLFSDGKEGKDNPKEVPDKKS
jgi:thiosulfate reductase cytochrome b subunit